MAKHADLTDFSAKPETYYHAPRAEMLPFVPESARRILEVGCAGGQFGGALKARQGAEVWGLELDSDAAALAEKRLDRVLVGDATQTLAELPDNYFNCVVCNDVIEHLADPYRFVTALKPKIAAGGVLVASIPNVRHYRVLYKLLFKKDWQYQDSGVLDKTHLRFFTERSIRRSFSELGYQVESITGISRSRNRKVRLLSWLTFGGAADMAYAQFACLFRPESAAEPEAATRSA